MDLGSIFYGFFGDQGFRYVAEKSMGTHFSKFTVWVLKTEKMADGVENQGR